ncbi:MAG: hypothetical protein LBU85_05785 [Treponema sp.]|nr:hypothetical protein [Treponema sp.]
MANILKEFPIFTKLDKRQATLSSSRFKVYLKGFEADCGIIDIHTSNSTMLEIYERIEKRRVYFHVFTMGVISKDIYYSFRFRDISKELIMVLVESMII